MPHPIAVAYGDGIGPEIMEATLHVLHEAGANLEIHNVEIGEKVYQRGALTGIEPKTWEILRATKAFLKAPITTPQGGGFKSLNVTIRTSLGLFANIRPCVAYAPFVTTKHPGMDVVIVRENEEDLYVGIEYRQTPGVSSAQKIISRQGSEKIVRYAFEYARREGRKKVTCFIKDNILKLTDGLFHEVFKEIAGEYPDLESNHWIVDIGAAKLADNPTQFDVIVMPNLYGDILSDVAAEISGSVGIAGSSNIGDFGAMFEAIHGSAPRRASQNVANPSGLLQAAIQMLNYLGEVETASRIHNAWLVTLEEGIHTYDIFNPEVSKVKVGTQEFAHAVASNLGNKPHTLKPSHPKPQAKMVSLKATTERKCVRRLVGVDIYFYHTGSAQDFIEAITALHPAPFKVATIMNRGAKLWPQGQPETVCIEEMRARFLNEEEGVSQEEIVELLKSLIKSGYDLIRTENLYHFDGIAGYSSSDSS